MLSIRSSSFATACLLLVLCCASYRSLLGNYARSGFCARLNSKGVAFGTNTLEILLKLDWVRPAGRKDVPGKPIQYETTENFLNHFNIQKLSDLPTVEELSSAGLIDKGSIDSSIFGTSKFFKEQTSSKNEKIYSDIEKAIDQAPKTEE